MKLWDKGYTLEKIIEKYTVGNDHILDEKLVVFDIQASKAHAQILEQAEILTSEECKLLQQGLEEILQLHRQGKFVISVADEDCHTAIEKYLTQKYGEVGKKIHCARSRNDQVLTALRLFEKSKLAEIKEALETYQHFLSELQQKHQETPLPGYTHMRKAMPTSVAIWLGCFIDAGVDNLCLLQSAQKIIDQSPLGTAAGFGVPVFNLDRQESANIMGFAKVLENPIYAQMSRGKFEITILHALSAIMYDLNRLATDIITFSMDEFGFFSLAKKVCTGSSIMPQKKNPDVLELIRANYYVVCAEEMKVKNISSGLISGYHRDLQFTKEPVMRGLEITKDSLLAICVVLKNLEVNVAACKKAMSEELFATEQAYKLVKQGKSFRDAYQEIGKKYL